MQYWMWHVPYFINSLYVGVIYVGRCKAIAQFVFTCATIICVADAVKNATMKGMDMNEQMMPSLQMRIASWKSPAISDTDTATPTCTRMMMMMIRQ